MDEEAVQEEDKIPVEEKTEAENLEQASAKAKEYYDQILRLQAEFANFRKRTEKEKTEAIRYGREVILEHLIGLTDVMENALQHSQNAADINALKKGFEMVVQEFTRFLKSEGAEPLKTVGEPFDPHRHEAVAQIETEDAEKNDTVVEELQKGYMVNGRLMRAARVKVAKFKSKETEETKEKES